MSNPDPIVISDTLGLSGSEMVGLIVGVVCGGTLLVLIVLIATFTFRYIVHRRRNSSRSVAEVPVEPMNWITPLTVEESNGAVMPLGVQSRSPQDGYITSKTFKPSEEQQEPAGEQETTLTEPVRAESEAEATEMRAVSQPLELSTSLVAQVTVEEEPDGDRPQPIGIDATDMVQIRQFPREDLMLQEKLGEGEYGPIYRGEAYGLEARNTSKAVTVKMLSPQEAVNNRSFFDMDIEMLTSINHLNVVGLLAICTKGSPESILLDAGLPGDLLTYIREKKDEVALNIATEAESIELLRIADEISLGMTYLSSELFIHKDLALRNCIIGQNGVVKIAHFGLGPVAYPEAYYRVNNTDLPIRWMPSEAISSANFTTWSDVWSFGVTLWELFTYGNLPYEDLSDEIVVDRILGGRSLLNKPTKCSNDIFDIMKSCWKLEPRARIGFMDIHEKIEELTGFSSPLAGATPMSPLSPITLKGFEMDSSYPSTFKAGNTSANQN